MNDKKIELNRYDKKAQEIINNKNYHIKVPSYLNSAHNYYFSLFEKLNKKSNLLEIGAGTGDYTGKLIKMSFNVCATDLSEKSIEVMNKRYSQYKNFSSKIADMEKLPFDNESFDIICSAGSLSYGDSSIVMNEIYRVLKYNGIVIFVDSLNNNPIYKLNRYIHYLKNNRTKSTLKQTADINLINKYINKFGEGDVKYFGSITWLFPFLKILLKDELICNLSNWVDSVFNIKYSAFKFVLLLKKNAR